MGIILGCSIATLNARGALNNDSLSIEALIAGSVQLRNSNADSALFLAEQALKHSQSLADPRLMTKAYNQLGVLHRYRGELDLALQDYQQRLQLCEQLNDSLCMAKTWHNLGVIERKRGALSDALEYELKCLPHFAKAGDSVLLGHALNSIGNTYALQGNWEKAVDYYYQQLAIQQAVGNQVGAARALYNIGVTFYEQSDLIKADSAMRESLGLSLNEGDKRAMANAYNNLGIIQKDLLNLTSAKAYFEKAAALQKEMEDIEGQLFTLLGLGELEELAQDWKSAERTFNEALTLAIETRLKDEELTIREHLALIFEKQNRNVEAIAQLKRASLLKDTLTDESTGTRLLELQEKYETDKKEQENKLLLQENQLNESEIEAQSQSLFFRNAALIVLFVILALSGLLLFNYSSRLKANRKLATQREELNRQKMLDLVREQELAYVNATLIGQETERKRIAMELHDGLSNMLVTVKLHFENLADQLESNNPSALKKYGEAVHLLDDLCKKARGLSHELADEHSQFRLEPALKELVGIIEGTGQLQVELSLHALERPIGSSIENAVFHTLRELIGNCLKHAEAKTLFIQLTRFNDSLNVMVEDDGKGFDLRKVPKNSMGFANLNSRVEKIGGTLHIDTAVGRGTVVNIDIPIELPKA